MVCYYSYIIGYSVIIYMIVSPRVWLMQWTPLATIASIDMQLDSDIWGPIVYLMMTKGLAKTEHFTFVAPNVVRTMYTMHQHTHIDGLVQKRCNSSALEMELRISCINPYTYSLSCLALCVSPWWPLFSTFHGRYWFLVIMRLQLR